MDPANLRYHKPMSSESSGAAVPLRQPVARRVAFFGGSFDPPHLGHIAVAQAAQRALNLDQVLFAPVGLQPLKPTGSSASFEDRVAMTRLAIADHPGFSISLLDAPSQEDGRTGTASPNYTVDTLARLRESLPQNTTLFLLLGADSFRTLHHWHHAAEIPFLASLIVASRPGEDLSNLSALLPRGLELRPISDEPNQYRLLNATGDRSSLTILPDLNYDISATQLRTQLLTQLLAHVHGQSGAEPPLLSPAVLAYVLSHHLYA